MALTDDQKAMLRLLAQREQGYEDIAALTGQGVDGVRAKVKEALAALDRPQAPADDQKAMLRLLAQREQGYEDIAALTGRSIGDVRAKVNEALAELEGPGAPPAKAPPPELEPTPPPPPPQPTPKAPTSASKPGAAGTWCFTAAPSLRTSSSPTKSTAPRPRRRPPCSRPCRNWP